MTDASVEFEEFVARSHLETSGAMQIGRFAANHNKLIRQLETYDPLKLAATYAGLLTQPELQSNCLRLEVSVHLAIAFARGNKKPNAGFVTRAFAALGNGIAGRYEDPAEDVFVASITTPRGDFRVLEGIWESAGFYTQRIMNILEMMPYDSGYDDIRDSAYALLQLSDLICERAKLERYQLGNAVPQSVLASRHVANGNSLRHRVRFSLADLEGHHIHGLKLEPFVFNPDHRNNLAEEVIGHSTLERYPLAKHSNEFWFLLPTATSAAIRRFVMERLEGMGFRNALLSALANEYGRTFYNTPLLGGKTHAPIRFVSTKSGPLASVMSSIDVGRFVHFVFAVDPLDNFSEGGLAGINLYSADSATELNDDIDKAYEAVKRQPDFRAGLTIIVYCGIGRAVVSALRKNVRPDWRIETISAPDLLTLSWVPDFKPLSLWRILDAEGQLESLGATLQNMNGLLNMVAWTRSLEGHLVPHGQVPERFGADARPTFIVINQNSLRDLRHEVAVRWDVRSVQNVRSQWASVRKHNNSAFEEDIGQPLYAAEARAPTGWLPGVYLARTRAFWVEIDLLENISPKVAFERWRMLMVWLGRLSPVLEARMKNLPSGPLLWRVRFTDDGEQEPNREAVLSYEDVRQDITVESNLSDRVVAVTVGMKFISAIFHAENIAECALVSRTIDGFASLATQHLSSDEHEALLRSVVPDGYARQMHAFLARHFRDFVRSSLPAAPVTVDRDDGAALKLGLGWRIRDRKEGGDIQGKDACTRYLNSLVRLIEDELCTQLRQFNRRAIVDIALLNHESAAVDRELWRRTAGAVLALHDDKEAALQTMADHDFKLNGVFQGTRILLEIALCESPIVGGLNPGALDLSRLMAWANLLPGMGGWSDAIRWDAIEPRVRITPFGDVHASHVFAESIVEPFGRVASDDRVDNAIKGYSENLKEVDVIQTVDGKLERAFLDAWEEEFSASLDAFRKFADFVEDLGIRQNQALLHVPKGQLLGANLEKPEISPEAAEAIVEALTFKPRATWRDIPPGYDEKDRQPWRFRRRLSILRKPLLQIDEAPEPTIVVAPGLLREGLAYAFGNYLRGDFPVWQLKPAMRAWAGSASDRRGREFNIAVADKLKESSWTTEPEVKITKLLEAGFDQDFGDVDVLAWDQRRNRVLVIECKDLQYRKTYGEIAEQLADFRGEIKPDGKPDHLLRHLRRVELISNNRAALMTYIGFSQEPIVESHLVFRNPVPVQFALVKMAERVQTHTFDSLRDI